MAKGRPGRTPSGFEPLSERPGFRATAEQVEWLERARKAAKAMSVGEWLRSLAMQAGTAALTAIGQESDKWPERKMVEPETAAADKPKSGSARHKSPSSKGGRR